MLRRAFFLVPLAMLLAACSTTPPVKPNAVASGDYHYTEKYLRWMIQKEMDDNNVTGLSIALVDDQRVVWAEGFGYADKENHIAATPQTPYRMGSIAKVLTASAAMQMAEQGKLDIDAPLSRALPGFSIKTRFPDAGPITPRNIMTHHSGLPSNYLQGMVVSHPKYFTTLVDDIKNEYVAYPPNYIFSYSNLGVTLLGAAIEHQSGMPYADYMTKSFFEPLGMHRSYYSSEPGLKGYNHGKQGEPLPLRDLPSGGLVSTVDDMSRFIRMVFAGGRAGDTQVLSPQSVAEMLRPQTDLPLDLNNQMGLGWMLSGYDIENAGAVAGHGGSLLNFHSVMIILPEHHLGVVVAANSDTSRSVVNEVGETALKLALEAKTGIKQPEHHKTTAVTAKLSDEDAKSFSGYFDSLVGVVKISDNSGDLDADVLGHSFRLTPHDDGTFGIRYKLFGLIPVSVSAFDNISVAMKHIDGHDLLVGNLGSDIMLFGEKLQKPAKGSALIDYVGDYEIVNPWKGGPMPENLALRHKDGMFIVECSFAQMPGFVLRMAVDPISSHEAVVAGLGPGRGETIRLETVNNEKHVLFSGLDLRKID